MHVWVWWIVQKWDPKHSAFLEGNFQRLYGIGINFTGKCELNSKFNAMRILNGELRPWE